MITSYNFLIYDFTIWILDIESLFNICNSLQDLQVSKRFEESERFLNVGNGRSVSVLVSGIIKFVFKSNVIILNEYHFYLFFLLNIIFVGLLAMYDYEIFIKKIILISLWMVLIWRMHSWIIKFIFCHNLLV